jgi:DUF4097 and DUF4098 domain-containing protein YvlB
MRPRSISGPLILVAIGVFFLLANVRPDLVSFSRIADYWPFLLIAAGAIGLVEVLYYVSRGANPAPRPLYGAGIFWVLVAGLLISVLSRNHDFRFGRFGSPGVSVFGSDYDYDIGNTESATGVTRVVLDNLHGNLSLKGESAGDVRVSGRKTIRAMNRTSADRANEQTQIHLERHGDLLMIRTEDSSQSRRIQITTDLDITIPRGINVESRGRTGDLTIDDIDGAVDVSTGRGDVRLSHIGRDVRIEASRSGEIHVVDVKGGVELQGRGSDVQLDTIAGPVTVNGEYSGTLEFRALMKPMHFLSSRTEFSVEAIPGTIVMDLGTLKLANVSGPVRFKTGTRDVEASDVTDALDLTLDRGDVQVTATKTPVPKIDVHLRNGDISLTLPAKAAFQLNGSTSQGEVENEFGTPLETQSYGRSASIKGQNGAGPQISIATDRGTVSVKKI